MSPPCYCIIGIQHSNEVHHSLIFINALAAGELWNMCIWNRGINWGDAFHIEYFQIMMYTCCILACSVSVSKRSISRLHPYQESNLKCKVRWMSRFAKWFVRHQAIILSNTDVSVMQKKRENCIISLRCYNTCLPHQCQFAWQSNLSAC